MPNVGWAHCGWVGVSWCVFFVFAFLVCVGFWQAGFRSAALGRGDRTIAGARIDFDRESRLKAKRSKPTTRRRSLKIDRNAFAWSVCFGLHSQRANLVSGIPCFGYSTKDSECSVSILSRI